MVGIILFISPPYFCSRVAEKPEETEDKTLTITLPEVPIASLDHSPRHVYSWLVGSF